MHERQEIEPASSTPTPRIVRNAPSEMACPYAAVFRLFAPLVAHSCIRLAIRGGQSHPVSWTQAQPSDWDRIATALSGSGHSAAKEEHAPSATLPPTSPHAIVWCGETPVLQSPVIRRSTRARQAQAAPGAHAGQSAPKTPSKRATRLATGPRSAWTARWQVGREHCLSRNVTKRHYLAIFASHFRGRVRPQKNKCHLESGLNQRDEGAHGFSVIQVPVVPRSKTSTGGVL